ncbi:MAG TPA: hypothetical protein VF266_01820 [Thermoanaerobaculia bacterium]
MTPQELALLYLKQLQAAEESSPPAPAEPNALFLWEELIDSDPEQAWPVFEQVLLRASDDDTLEQVWYRLRMLLYRHYDAFHERAAELLARFPRFAVVAGDDALERERYEERPLDREALIVAYRTVYRTHALYSQVEQLAKSDPHRALAIAVEILHRGIARGWTTFDVQTPFADLISHNGRKVERELVRLARESVAVRRVLWRLKRHLRPWSGGDDEARARSYHAVDADVWERLQLARGTTTDYTERDVPPPPPQPQLDADERLIEGWFAYEEHFWAFSALDDLRDEDPRLAWSITLELIERAEDEDELGYVAAGPLEDLIKDSAELIWDDLTKRAYENAKFREALRGVWIFEGDAAYERYVALMETIPEEPN